MSADVLGRCCYVVEAALSLRDESSSVKESVMFIGVCHLYPLLTLLIIHHFSSAAHFFILLKKRFLNGSSLNLPLFLANRSDSACLHCSGSGL